MEAEEKYLELENLAGTKTQDVVNAERAKADIQKQIKEEKTRQLKAATSAPSAEENAEMNKKMREQAELEARAKEEQQRMLDEADARRLDEMRRVREDNKKKFERGMDAFN